MLVSPIMCTLLTVFCAEMKKRLNLLLNALCSGDTSDVMHDLWSSITFGLQSYGRKRYDPRPRFDNGQKPAWHDYSMTARRLGTSSALLSAAHYPAVY